MRESQDTSPLCDPTALLAHELQTPLTSIRVRLQGALSAGWCRSDCQNLLRECLREVEHTSRMVHDLLLLSQSDAERSPPHRAAVDLAVLTTVVAEGFRSLAQTKGVALDVTGDEALKTHGDETALERVLSNLIDNAVKYTPPGGLVCVGVAREASEAWVTVRDNGPGIDRRHLPHIFERFYRVDKDASRGMGGAGLGLAIAKTLARRNGGELRVTSEPGAGTTFILSLPLVDE